MMDISNTLKTPDLPFSKKALLPHRVSRTFTMYYTV